MNITKTPTGKYYVSIFTEQSIEQLPKKNKQCGIDLGLKDFVITFKTLFKMSFNLCM